MNRSANADRADPKRESLAGLARLGRGGEGDALGLPLVLQVLRRCLGLLGAVRVHLIRLGILSAIATAFGLPFLLFVPDILWTRVLQGEPLTELEARVLLLDPKTLDPYDAAARQLVRDRWLALVGVLSVGGLAVFGPLAYYALWVLQTINQELRLELLDRLQALSLRFHAHSRIGDGIYRVYQDSAQITAVIETAFLRPAWSILAFLSAAAFTLLLSPVFALGLLLLAGPVWLLGRLFSPALRKRFRRAREANSALTATIQESLTALRVIKAYQAEGRALARFDADSQAAFERARQARVLVAWFGVLAFFVAGTALVALIAYAAWLARTGAPLLVQGLGFSVFTLGIFTIAVSRIGAGSNALEMLLRYWGRTQDVVIGLDRAFELLDLEPEVVDRADARPLEGLEHAIQLSDVSFGYVADRPVLDGLTLTAPSGSLTAIVGATGSGKSTLLALLLRLYDPDRGSISIDGIDLRDLERASLRRQVSIALQENLLFSASVRDNIRYAVPQASDAQVIAAARVACADEFIHALPEGYDTLLGERGAKLSTGQRQRLSLARALIRNTPILLLDEPTSALDAETEQALLRNLTSWGRGRVIFWVTHRLSTVRHADTIVVLDAGRVVEHGSHDELIVRRGGQYARLVELDTGRPAQLPVVEAEAGA